MEKTEPALVPEWLRCTGNVSGGGTLAHQSDVSSFGYSARSRSFRSNPEKDSPHSLEKSSSSNSRRNYNSNGSARNPYSSFTRSHRDKNRDREKDKSLSVDIWDHDSSDPLASILTSKVEKIALSRSHSLISRKPGDVLTRRIEDSKNGFNRQSNSNGLQSGSSNFSGNQKAAFEKDFPSLGVEEKQGFPGIRRVSSPGLSSAVQSLSIGSSGFLGGEKWTSALAEVPAILANIGVGHSTVLQSTITNLASASGTSTTAGLNMAEALSQPPMRTRTTTQLPDKTQRLEDLAIKQSRQLIPMTPSMSKPLVTSSADKSKLAKTAVRTNEMNVASRVVHPQPHSSHLSIQARAGPVRSDSLSNSHVGKFLVLKPGRENGVITGAKDIPNVKGDANSRVSTGQHGVAPSIPTASASLNNSVVSASENKAAALSLNSRSNVDKRSSQSLAQSRSEFFNLMRRKTSTTAAANLSESSLAVSSPSAETYGVACGEHHAVLSSHVLANGSQMGCNGDGKEICDKAKSFSDVRENNFSGDGAFYPDEEEAAFLRSLGWEENGGEDEGLTEEEINAFYQEYMKRRPTSLPRCSTLSEFHTTVSVTGNLDSSSSESESDLDS